MQNVYRHKVLNSYDVYSSSDSFLPNKQETQGSPKLSYIFHVDPKNENKTPVKSRLFMCKWKI